MKINKHRNTHAHTRTRIYWRKKTKTQCSKLSNGFYIKYMLRYEIFVMRQRKQLVYINSATDLPRYPKTTEKKQPSSLTLYNFIIFLHALRHLVLLSLKRKYCVISFFHNLLLNGNFPKTAATTPPNVMRW